MMRPIPCLCRPAEMHPGRQATTHTPCSHISLRGLRYNVNRRCDPQVGWWISEDPIGFAGGDVNLMRYVGNGVLSAIDPTGLHFEVGGQY